MSAAPSGVWKLIVDTAYSLPPMDSAEIATASREIVENATDRASAAAGTDGSRVVREAAEVEPRRVLRDLQSEADLIVVDAGGRTGLSHRILGSTTSALIHRPHCPIAIVPRP